MLQEVSRDSLENHEWPAERNFTSTVPSSDSGTYRLNWTTFREKQLGASTLVDATMAHQNYRIDDDPESELTTLGKLPKPGVRCGNE